METVFSLVDGKHELVFNNKREEMSRMAPEFPFPDISKFMRVESEVPEELCQKTHF